MIYDVTLFMEIMVSSTIRGGKNETSAVLNVLTLKVLVTTIDALGHFETGS